VAIPSPVLLSKRGRFMVRRLFSCIPKNVKLCDSLSKAGGLPNKGNYYTINYKKIAALSCKAADSPD
jgi:hypothetical protein